MSNELATVSSTPNALSNMYSSITGDSQQDRLAVFDAVSNATPLEDAIGKKILVKDVVMQPVQLANRETGELNDVLRIVIVDEAGAAYACCSKGVETAMRNLFAIVGEPTWNPPIPLVPERVQGNNGFKYLTLTHPSK